jgi:hypothetical protein
MTTAVGGAALRAVESGDAWDQAAAERPTGDPTRPHYAALARLTAELDTLDAMVAEAELAERLAVGRARRRPRCAAR